MASIEGLHAEWYDLKTPIYVSGMDAYICV
jgi:hypothetical protein